MTAVLETPVLALNKNFMAVKEISAKKAFTLLCRGVAEAFDIEGHATYDFDSWRALSEYHTEFEPDKYTWVQCIGYRLAIPRVIRLLGYDKYRRPGKLLLNRKNLYTRDNHKCQYCGKRFATEELNIDHVIPVCQGGQNTWENLVCCCVSCNTRKGGRTPKQANMKLVKNPARPDNLAAFKSTIKHKSWAKFVDEAYWNTELK